jgi:uncharacterized repeat protein (TIGR03803 family)
MNHVTKHRTTLSWLVAALVSLSVLPPIHAQPAALSVLHTFTGSSPQVETVAGLVLSSNVLYGAAGNSVNGGSGTVFSLNTDGLGFTNLYIFTATTNSTNSDGALPQAGVILSGNTLYGTTTQGGSGGSGAVFRVNTDGSDFTNLYSFTALSSSPSYTNSDGANPSGALILSSNTLYGTATIGGRGGAGTVFRVSTGGLDFTNLHSFTGASDGTQPTAPLVLSGNRLYGTAVSGGSNGWGTVFSVNTDGLDFTNLHNFNITNANDGAAPTGGLIVSGNTLYGEAAYNGSGGFGMLFSVNTDGSDFTNLFSFTTGSTGTYSDGSSPQGGLTWSGNTLYGTAEYNGLGTDGDVFSVNTNGSAFTVLYNFTGLPIFGTNSNGAYPNGVILSGNTLYGTTESGGSNGFGNVFALSLPAPSLGIAPAGSQIVLSWPASASNYVLQTAADLSSGSWSNITNGVFTSGTNYVLTNTVSNQAAFFRLQQE